MNNLKLCLSTQKELAIDSDIDVSLSNTTTK